MVAGVLSGALLGLWYLGRAQPPATNEAVGVSETVVDAKPTRTGAEPGEPIELPPLDESDAVVRMLVSRLSSHPQVASWLATDNLLRNIAVVIDNLARGETPARRLRALRPGGSFAVRGSGANVSLDPASYRRYDSLAAAVDSVDARGAARFYATVKPRLVEAYQELGAEDDVDGAVQRAIVTLLQTPIVEGDIPLRAVSVSYAFADPELEGLTKAQRQFLRMGPGNMRTVKAKLREVAAYLGMPESSLPPPDPER